MFYFTALFCLILQLFCIIFHLHKTILKSKIIIIYIKVEHMIIPSKQLLLLHPGDRKEILMFDPKTGCLLQTYRSQSQLAHAAAYYNQGQQFIVPHLNNSYVNVWDIDSQDARKFTLGAGERITSLTSGDGNLLYAGSSHGLLYIYELPSGILIKKAQLHSQSTEITKIIVLADIGSLISVTSKQIKRWSFYSLLNSKASKPLAQNTIQSVLPIISVQIIRNILCVISEKSIQFYYVANFTVFSISQDIPQMQGISCACCSKCSLFVGDSFGKIRQIVLDCGQKQLKFEQRKGHVVLDNKNGLFIQGKQPIVSMLFIESEEYLVWTNTKGELKISHKGIIKNSLQLSKSALTVLAWIDRPNKQIKITQSSKIKSFHKQELSKVDQPILYNSGDGIQLHAGTCQTELQITNDLLTKTLVYLSDDIEQQLQQAKEYKKENQILIESNLKYFNLLERANN